ncbi:MAG: hypothetical protein JXO22_16950, partial [Phycisphaerae bacterium]|nr:hypothetical protein [Phycisphaerae bacterium]
TEEQSESDAQQQEQQETPATQASDPNQPTPTPQDAAEQQPRELDENARLTPMQVQQLLQRVRDADRARREELRRRAMIRALHEARNRPVDRDW